MPNLILVFIDVLKNIQTEKSYTKMSNEKKICLNVVDSIEKYQVDVLGNYQKVDLPEKRMTFSKEG